MGQKSIRPDSVWPVSRNWASRWQATVTSPACWLDDIRLRKYLKDSRTVGVSRVLIGARQNPITIYSARPAW